MDLRPAFAFFLFTGIVTALYLMVANEYLQPGVEAEGAEKPAPIDGSDV